MLDSTVPCWCRIGILEFLHFWLYNRSQTLDPSPSNTPIICTPNITAMAPPNTIYPIPPNHFPVPMPDLSAITLQSPHPSPQQQSTLNALFYSRLHPAPMLAFPLHHPEPLAFGPSGIARQGHDHDHPIPQPIMRDHTWDPTMSAPIPQVFRSDAWVPNIEPEKGTAAAHKHLWVLRILPFIKPMALTLGLAPPSRTTHTCRSDSKGPPNESQQ